jgi:hypothetical protein
VTGRRPLAAWVVSAPVLVVGVAIAGRVSRPHLSPLSDTVSHLASTDQTHRWVAAATFVAYGLLVLAGAWGRRTTDRRWMARLLGLYGIAGVIAGMLPKDPPGPHHTSGSAAHVVATIVGGSALVVTMVLVAIGHGRRVERVTAALGVAWVAGWALVFRASWGSHWYGLYERLLIGGGAAWLSLWAALRYRCGERDRHPLR